VPTGNIKESALVTLSSIDPLFLVDSSVPEGVDSTIYVHKKVGVPQGAATSCSLSTISIHEVTDSGNIERKLAPNHGGIVMYADDGVIFLESSDDLSKVLEMFSNSGVSINESKSG